MNRLDVGGLENGVVNLLNRLPASRYEQAVVCLSGYSESFRKRITNVDTPVVSMDKKPGKDFAAYLRMFRFLRSWKPDIVHTRNLGTMDIQWIAAAAGVRHRVHGEHGWEASDPRGTEPRRLRLRRLLKGAVHLFVPMSMDIAQWLQQTIGVDSKKIRQLYNGVDTERFRPAAAQASDGIFRIGTVGRLDPVKNQSILLHALHTLKVAEPTLASALRLNIAGAGPLLEALERLTMQLGLADQVSFAGEQSDVPAFMRALDVFVLPSVNEGISNTILEAMATGLPVVAARVGGNPELVEHGTTGMLYDPSDEGALVRSLLCYLSHENLRREHGAAGRVRAVQCFSLQAMVDGYDALYGELLGLRTDPRPAYPLSNS